MADLTITAANVATNATNVGSFLVVTFGETVTRGQPVYLKESDGEYYKAQADGTSAEATVAGIVQIPGGDGEKGLIQVSEGMDLGATLAVGVEYYLSETAGGICPRADLATTGDYVTRLGIADAADNLTLKIEATGVQVP